MSERTIERVIRDAATLPTIARSPRYRKRDLLEESLVDDYAKATLSSPEDWWHGFHFLMALAGNYGEEHKVKARQDLLVMRSLLKGIITYAPDVLKALSVITRFALDDTETSVSAVDAALKRIDANGFASMSARMAAKKVGRKHGKSFTLFAASGGAWGQRRLGRKKSKKLINASNSTLITIGTIWRYYITTKGKNRGVLDAYYLIISGDWAHNVDNRVVTTLITELRSLSIGTDSRLDTAYPSRLQSLASILEKAHRESAVR